jgi:hypothetical protein
MAGKDDIDEEPGLIHAVKKAVTDGKGKPSAMQILYTA